MAFASFSHANGSVTFTRSPQRPDNSLGILQPQRTTPGGCKYSYTPIILQQNIRLPVRLTTAQKNQILTFFNTTVSGMSETFTYTNPAGVAVVVRFASTKLDFTETAYDAWTGTIDLLRVVKI